MNKTTLYASLILAISFGVLAFVIGFIVGTNNAPIRKEIVTEKVSRELSEWDIMKMALIKTESEFDTLAVGKSADWGILQITPIYVEEVNRIIGEKKYIHEDAFNPIKSLEMFEIMQAHHNPKKDIDKAIASHNPSATSAYSVKVRRNMAEIRLYESIKARMEE